MSDENLFPIDIRHDERISTVQRDVTALGIRFDRHLEIYAQNGKEMAGMKGELASLTKTMNEVKDFIRGSDDKFVTKIEFWPNKVIVYGLVGVVLFAALGAIISQVIK